MKEKPKKEPRKAGIVAIDKLIPNQRTSLELWKSLRKTCTIANANLKNVRTNADGLPALESLTVHQKMKIAQDFIMGAVLSPEIGEAFLEEARLKPMEAMKLAVAIMPKELNIDVQHKQGVIMVPMREDSFEAWLEKATNQAGLTKQVDETHDWNKILDAEVVDAGEHSVGPVSGPADDNPGSDRRND